jgi:hypothetical protein
MNVLRVTLASHRRVISMGIAMIAGFLTPWFRGPGLFGGHGDWKNSKKPLVSLAKSTRIGDSSLPV